MAAKVVRWVIRHAATDLRASEMLVALLLAEHAGEDGSHAYPSIATLAQETRLGERTVTLALRELTRREIIAVECAATNKLPTMYCFPSYRGADIAPPRGANAAPREPVGVQNAALGVQTTQVGVQFTTNGGADPAPKPSEEPSDESPEEPSEGGAHAPPVKGKTKKRATLLPEDWDEQPFGPLYDWALKELGMNPQKVDYETDKFLDYWRGSGEAKADWLATWRNWMRRSQEGFRGRVR